MVSWPVREEIIDFPGDLFLPNYHFIDCPSIAQNCVSMLLKNFLLIHYLMDLQLIYHLIIPLKRLLQISGDAHNFLLLLIRGLFSLILP